MTVGAQFWSTRLSGDARIVPWHQDAPYWPFESELLTVEQYGRAVPFELRTGEISLDADLLAHGSPANHSMRRRSGLTMRYCPVAVRAGQSDWNAHSILCWGRDPAGCWANVPRPTREDLTSKAWQRAVRAG